MIWLVSARFPVNCLLKSKRKDMIDQKICKGGLILSRYKKVD